MVAYARRMHGVAHLGRRLGEGIGGVEHRLAQVGTAAREGEGQVLAAVGRAVQRRHERRVVAQQPRPCRAASCRVGRARPACRAWRAWRARTFSLSRAAGRVEQLRR